MGGQANHAVSKFTKCRHESPDTMKTKGLSEYQAAYKLWPHQPVRQILKPVKTFLTKETVRNQTERKSVYGIDYGNVTKQRVRRKPLKHKPNLVCPTDLLDTKTTYKLEYFAKTGDQQDGSNTGAKKGEMTSTQHPLMGDSIYTGSYPAYDKGTIASCKQPAIKAKDNIEVPPQSKSESNAKSTAQKDFIHHQNVERPVLLKAKENHQRSTDPIQSNTEYSDYFTDKMKDVQMGKSNPVKSENTAEKKQFIAISTAMADYTKPEGHERQKPCPPTQASNHFITAPFDGRTTFNMAYKPWPVKRQEVPSWAKRPEYKRPKGGILVNSLYMHDYREPQMTQRPAPCRPKNLNSNVIENNGQRNMKFENISTYKKDFQPFEDAEPPQSYHIVEVYKPPAMKMDCETNQRSSFKGEPSEKMLPCRHISEHRKLNNDTKMTFITTYMENYVPPRPLSCPSQGRCSTSASKARVNSAPLRCPAPPPSTPKSTENFYPIPKPDLVLKASKDSNANQDDKESQNTQKTIQKNIAEKSEQ